VWIAFLIWFLIIVALLAAILLLARAESHRDAFSASIPDGQEYDARRAFEEEQQRGSARIVAPGIVIAPETKVEPGATALPADATVADGSNESDSAEPVVLTSQKVVEVKGIFSSRKPLIPESAEAATQEPTSESTLEPAPESASESESASEPAAQPEVVPTSAAVADIPAMPLPSRDESEKSEQQKEAMLRVVEEEEHEEATEGSPSLANLVSKTEAKETTQE
jgi:hypothetical protein